jgi:hypothetical protein
MLTRKRFSIALLMAIVFLVAADFAIVRALWDTNDPIVVTAIVTLPTVNLLLLALPKVKRGRETRPFWLGFEAVGWMAVILVALLAWAFDMTIFDPLTWIDDHDPFQHGSAAEIAFLISSAVVLYSTPQWISATIGGWIWARYRLVLPRG